MWISKHFPPSQLSWLLLFFVPKRSRASRETREKIIGHFLCWCELRNGAKIYLSVKNNGSNICMQDTCEIKRSDRPLTQHEMLFDASSPCVNVQIIEHWIQPSHLPFLQIVLFHFALSIVEWIRRFYLQFISVIKNHAITLIAHYISRQLCSSFFHLPLDSIYALIVWHTSRNAHDTCCVCLSHLTWITHKSW